MKQTPKTLFSASMMTVVLLSVCLLRSGGMPLTPSPQPTTPQSLTQHSQRATQPQATYATASSAQSPAKAATAVEPVLAPHIISKHTELQQSVAHEYVYHLFSAPNDPRYSGDWPLQKDNAPAAWPITAGNNQTTVAIIDSGFALSHEDLTSQWYTNPGETGMTQPGDRCWTGTPANKQTNNCDDDNNGYVDDWRGWNFTTNDNNPQAGRTNVSGTGVSHGTEVAGLVGATGNNGLGSTAINQHTKIMPLQALSDDGVGYTSGVAAAIYYAIAQGAQVINLSMGTYSDDPTLKAAIDTATAHNVVVVAAAGNCGDGTGSGCQGVPAGTIAYPAAYSDVIAVGATTSADSRASFGSFGSALDVSAPGYNLPVSTSWSATNQTSLYAGGLYGTSFSAPQVSSLVSLIRSIRPNSSVQDVTAIIDGTAARPVTMGGLYYTNDLGHGIIDAGAALTIAATLNAASGMPTLLQAGSFQSEHSTPTNAVIGSGCQGVANSACTIQISNLSTGYKRYLPYQLTSTSGTTGWSWSSTMLDIGDWEIHALSGDTASTLAYPLFRAN